MWLLIGLSEFIIEYPKFSLLPFLFVAWAIIELRRAMKRSERLAEQHNYTELPTKWWETRYSHHERANNDGKFDPFKGEIP